MFKRVYLEISNLCNLQCSFCPSVEKDIRIMDEYEFESILKQVAPLTEIVCLHLMGEPLAHPKFSTIIDICEKYKVQIELTTNGILINKYKEKILHSKCVRQVNFSLQAFKDNFPDKDLEPYLSPIFDFVKLGNSINPLLYTNFRLWNMQNNDSDNNEIFDMIDKYFDVVINRNIELGAIKSKKIWNKLYLHFDSRFEWPSLNLPNFGTQGRCNGVLNHIGIHADGTVVPCCLDKNAEINLGNVNKNSLLEILNTDRFKAMQTGFINGVLVEELCQHCSFIKRFKK